MKDIQLISFEKNPIKKLTGIYYKDGSVYERYDVGSVKKFSALYGTSDDKSKIMATISGKLSLAQKVLKTLFTKQGSDALAPDSGGSLYDMLKFYRLDDVENVRVSLPVMVKTIETQIKDQQLSQALSGIQLKDDEILDTLVLENYTYDHTFGGWIISLKIVTKAGTSQSVTIP